MKQAFWFLCAIIVFALASGDIYPVQAQTSSPTPDPFIVQLTNSPTGAFYSFVSDLSANGRFAVFESNGNVATQNKNNADGNREIFLIDYAQRRIFQITNTRSVPNPSPSPSPSPSPTPTPSPSPSPSPTPTPVPTPEDQSQVKILIESKGAMISLAPQVSGGTRVYSIIFSSNAPTPGNFDGTETPALLADANTEIWIYQLPAVTDVDLTLGQDLPFQDLSAGTFIQITNTPASRAPTAGSSTTTPFYADDNREGTLSDDGRILAFTSTRNLFPAMGNTDGNPEIFFFNRNSGSFVQGTNTVDAVIGVGFIFQQNPNLSSDGTTVAFYSSANLANNNSDGNGEVFVATFTGTAMTNVRQVTRTQIPANGQNVNVLSPGRRLSRDGSQIALESLATDPKANSTTNTLFLAAFVYTVASDTFNQVGLRALEAPGDIAHFPTFTDYNTTTLAPGSVIFASALNFRTDGSFPPEAQDAEGLNPQRSPQIFATTLPVSTSSTFVRLTNVPQLLSVRGTRPITSETRKRIVFSMDAELGGGNSGANDVSVELFYLLTPTVTVQSSAALSFFTGASEMAVPSATPVPSPIPSPTPTPSPSPGVALGLAPGELAIIRSTVDLAPSSATSTGGNENTRSPALPIELNGVSISINGAAAGLYFVGAAEKQINFVAPIGLFNGLGTVAVNLLNAGANTDTLFRGLVQIVSSQPDIFTSTNGPGGDAVAANVTNPNNRLPPPFNVTSVDAGGNTVPTVVELTVTGMRVATVNEITVTVGTTAITGTNIVFVGPNPAMPGFDVLQFKLPDTLAGAGSVPVVITFTRSGTTTTSRSDTPPRITIN